MKQFEVTGMSCAACVARVEKAVNSLPDVTKCSVSLLTNSMGVSGTASDEAVIKAVTDAGYGARVKGRPVSDSGSSGSSEEDALFDRETPLLVKRLIYSLIVLFVLLYVSMGHMMLGLPLIDVLNDNMVGQGIVQMFLAAIIMIINQKFFVSGFKAVLHLSPNMDTLVAMGSSVAFAYSFVILVLMSGGHLEMHDFYFETAAMIPTLITIGKTLEARAKGKTTDALKSLMKLAPKTATVIRDGKEEVIKIDEVVVGDIFVVRPGENIPVDGTVTEGHSAVNESALTGESIPVDKKAGSSVYSATINQSGFIKCMATKVGSDTTLSQIIKMVSDAAATKAPIARIADKVSGIFVPVVLAIAFVTFLIWMLVGENIGNALSYGIAVLVISCPCSLGLATPVAIMVGNGIGARTGVLFKTAASIEQCGKAAVVALDKTGTITKGQPVVTDIAAFVKNETDADYVLSAAYALEAKSEHPLARAIVKKAKELRLPLSEINDFKIYPGNGLSGTRNGKGLFGGNYEFIKDKVSVTDEALEAAAKMADSGKTPIYIAEDNVLLGIIAVADEIKEDSVEAIANLKKMGLKVVMLTGDNEKTAQAMGSMAGVDEVIAGVLPDGKDEVVKEIQKSGSVIMVGDGINDAPALTRADVGMAIGAGTDVAIDAADVVLMKSGLSDVVKAIKISRATLRNIHENLFWAFFYNTISIPVAAGALVSLTGLKLSPMLGAACMSLSSFCVVMNALRLNLISGKLKDSYDNDIINEEEVEEEVNMTKTINIDGMMCPRCEAHVKEALEAVPGVTSAVADRESKSATVTLSEDVADDVLKAAVVEAGYEVM